jgi:signal peptidase I
VTTDERPPDSEPAPVEEATEPSDAPVEAAPRRRRHLPVWQETMLLLVVAVALAIVIKALFFQAFYIPSESMEPGLIKNDRILVQKVSYWFGGTPERGDVVVFEDPDHWLGTEESGPTNPVTKVLAKVGLYPEGGHLVKRVIGVAGDTITCCDDQGRISVNGQPLDEEGYVADVKGVACNGPMTGNCDWSAGPVPEGHIFVMGDNRGMSADSSAPSHLCLENETDCTKNPYVDVDLVVGKVLAVVWPSDRLDWLSDPDSFDDVPEPE